MIDPQRNSTHKTPFTQEGNYLVDLLVPLRVNHEGLRSNNSVRCLLIPRTYRKTFTNPPFSIYRPKKWNQLPDKLSAIEDLDEFKAKLKMFFYNKSYT